MANVSVQIGAALGIAAMATVAASRTAGLIARHEQMARALTDGYRTAFLVGAGCTAVSWLVALVFFDSGRPHAAPEPAPDFVGLARSEEVS